MYNGMRKTKGRRKEWKRSKKKRKNVDKRVEYENGAWNT